MATQSDHVNNLVLATIVVVGSLVTLSIILWVTALVRDEEQAAVLEKGTTANTRPHRDLTAKQRTALGAPAGWVDRGQGIVSIPIERAMELVVTELRKDPEMLTPWSGKDAGGEARGAFAPAAEQAAPVAPSGDPAGQGAPSQPKAQTSPG